MNNKYFISFIIDKDGFIKKDLVGFDTLLELDNYTTSLDSRDGIYNDYKEVIDKYLENFKSKKSGRICITTYDKDGNMRFVPVLYKKNKKYTSVSLCLKDVKKALYREYALFDILKRKKYLLSANEKYYLKRYIGTKSEDSKKDFIVTFLTRVMNNSDDFKYYTLRSLLNTCKLLNKKEVISDTKLNSDTTVNNELESNNETKVINKSNTLDDYLNFLLESGRFEELYEYYTLDELSKNGIDGNDLNSNSKKLKK